MPQLTWIRVVVPVLLTIACIFTITGTSWCEFVRFTNADLKKHVNFTFINENFPLFNEADVFPDNINAGYWGVSRFLYVKDPLEDDENKTYTYKINVCMGYNTEDNVNFDSAFYAGRVFSTLTPILSIFVCIFTCFFSCDDRGKARMKLMSYLLLLTTLFSGLMFLIFSSAVCNTSNWGRISQQLVEEAHCQLGPGGNLAITSTVFYFIAAVLCFLYSRSADEEEGDEDGSPGDAEAGEDKPAEPTEE